MGSPGGFAYTVRGEDVVITHRGAVATTLRGARAAAFLEDVEDDDPQELMARLTGNYRRGNERQARQHPRNRGRRAASRDRAASTGAHAMTDPTDAAAPTAPLDDASAPVGTPFGFGIHHVQLSIPAGGEEVARAFYVGVLGLVEVQKPPVLAARGGLWVRADGIELHLGVEQDFRPAAKAHPGLLVADLDALVRHLEASGVAVAWDDNFPGVRRCDIRDPFGNRIELLHPGER